MMLSRFLVAGSSLLALTCSTAAIAQAAGDADHANAQAGSNSQDIVVTATRREESLLSVPVSVLASSQAKLDMQGVRSIDDLARVSPGVSFNTGFSGIKYIAIRGLFSSVGATPTGVYIDDTPVQVRSLSTTTNFYPTVFDLDRVEVLRGPQGTLFGAGAMGGAIRYILAQPSLTKFSGNARVELGFTENGSPSYEAGAAIGGPIIQDKIGFRVSGYYRHDGGWIDRVPFYAYRGTPEKNSNWANNYSANAALTFAPTERLTITPGFFYEHNYNNDTDQFWTIRTNPAYPKFTSGEGEKSTRRTDVKLYSLKAKYDLGFATLISNSSILDRKTFTSDDATEAYLEILGLGFTSYDTQLPGQADKGGARIDLTSTQRAFTQEIRLQSNGTGRLHYVLGAFYQNSRQIASNPNYIKMFSAVGTIVGQGLLGVPIDIYGDTGPTGYVDTFTNTSRDIQLAGFGQVDFDLTSKLRLTAGVRVSRTRFDFTQTDVGPFSSPTSNAAGTTKQTPVTPKFGIQYTASKNLMLYATASKGFRQGGANANPDPIGCAADLKTLGVTTLPSSYKSDSVWSYEIGAKGRIGNKASFAVDAYDVEWSHIQQARVLPTCAFVYIDNFGKARSRGVDLQFDVMPFRGLTLGATLTYMDARFTQTTLTPSGLVNIYKGDRLGQARPWGANLSGDYETRLGGRDDLTGYAHMDYSWKSSMKSGDPRTYNFNPVYYDTEALHFLTARVGVRKGPFDISLYANNITNSQDVFGKLQWTGDVLAGGVYKPGTNRILASTYRPRTFGVTGKYRF